MQCLVAGLLTLILAPGIHAASQKGMGSIRGVVKDKDFDAPLANAQVQVVETGAKVMTTDQGTFVVPKLPAGPYTLTFSKAGYVRQIRSKVLVTAGKLTDVNVSLAGDITEMEEFVVQDTLLMGGFSDLALLQLRFKAPALMDSISADLMSRAGASTAASALTLVAGATIKDGKTAVIRGLPDRYVSTQINGVRLPSADEDKRAVELDVFPSAVIESLRVSKTFTPDQQGDASGGAVDVRLKGIPSDSFFFNFKGETGYNNQVSGRRSFLSYEGGGVSGWGSEDGRRDPQLDRLGNNWAGAVGTTQIQAPMDFKWSAATGGNFEIMKGVKFGGMASIFYERDSAFYVDGKLDDLWVEKPGAKMTPKQFQGTASQGDFKTALFDVTQGRQSVNWGGLGTLGLETENNNINFVYLSSRKSEDTATLAEDTRGKEYYFPGYDPDDPTTPGHDEPDAAPYIRLETLTYTERTTETLQFNGRHVIPMDDLGPFKRPIIDWTIARSKAESDQPDKRQFGSTWQPGRVVGPITLPPRYDPYKPSENFSLGNLQRIWKNISEESRQYLINIKVPFEQWSNTEGYFKTGVFHDSVHRDFQQDTYSNFNDNSSFEGGWNQKWSGTFRFEDHPITESNSDVDYQGDIEIDAYYAMIDLPLTDSLRIIGGARFESTNISVINDPEAEATWYPPGASAPVKLNPGDGDVDFDENEILPSVALVWEPMQDLMFRASYAETLARMTFKELTPILQQEFLGGPIFIGNPDLRMSHLRNYDLRLDYQPFSDGIFSVSWFRKDIRDPIEYVQKVVSFTYTTAENFPKGELGGWEFEARQNIGHFWKPMQGLNLGGNLTLIDSKVFLSDSERDEFNDPGIKAPMDSRDMTGAPDYLYNLYLSFDLDATDTRIGLFYTVKGDTLLSGAGVSQGNFVPSIYAKKLGTLNFTLAQKVGPNVQLFFKAKNLLNPDIQTVYRSPYIGADVLRSSYTRGIDFTIGISGQFNF